MPSDIALDTSPPPEQAQGSGWLKPIVRRYASVGLEPLIGRVLHNYIGGESLDEALGLARRSRHENLSSSLGFWNAPNCTVRAVTDDCIAAVDRLSEEDVDAYLSIKPPAFRFDRGLASELAAAAQTRRVRLHCDSHAAEQADQTNAVINAMFGHLPANQLGITLPGRWSRSLYDAEWAIECGLPVRVVKGQWPDPTDPKRDGRAGYLEVIDRLAGRGHHVAVAGHDVTLAAEAITRLRAAGTSCEIEVLFGYPMAEVLRWARKNEIAIRIYIPFGGGYATQAIREVRRRPRIVWLFIRDTVQGKLNLKTDVVSKD